MAKTTKKQELGQNEIGAALQAALEALAKNKGGMNEDELLAVATRVFFENLAVENIQELFFTAEEAAEVSREEKRELFAKVEKALEILGEDFTVARLNDLAIAILKMAAWEPWITEQPTNVELCIADSKRREVVGLIAKGVIKVEKWLKSSEDYATAWMAKIAEEQRTGAEREHWLEFRAGEAKYVIKYRASEVTSLQGALHFRLRGE